MNKLLLYCYYYLLWQPDSVLFNEKETHILKKKKIQQQKNKQKQTKNWSRGPLGPPYLHVVYIQPPSPGGKLKEFVGGNVPLRPWSP